jgi:hypothetical protein
MPDFAWMADEEDLSPAALTVRAQALQADDNGRLVWDQFFPRRDVDSVDVDDITVIDDRPTADRREWNARGRLIPIRTPEQRRLSIVPIEAYDKIEEKEMQKLAETAAMSGADPRTVYRNIIGVRIPDRVDRLAMADYRRLEVDTMQAWSAGTVTQRSPQDASKTYTMSYNFAAGRYETAATAWNDGSVNAYEEFVAWYQDAIDDAGPGAGAVMRRATRDAIVADAPTGIGGESLEIPQVEARIRQRLGTDFRFFLMENTVDIFTDGGVTRVRTKIWPVGRVAFVPAGISVGNTLFAPVKRAMDLVGQVGKPAGIDIRGVTIYYEEANLGRELTIEAQLNAAPAPNENLIRVINAGV